jgi:hypothetical protein
MSLKAFALKHTRPLHVMLCWTFDCKGLSECGVKATGIFEYLKIFEMYQNLENVLVRPKLGR